MTSHRNAHNTEENSPTSEGKTKTMTHETQDNTGTDTIGSDKETETPTVEPGYVKLADNQLACGDCGIRLKPKRQTGNQFETVATNVVNLDAPPMPDGFRVSNFHRVTAFSRCADCHERRQHALEMLTRHPEGAGRWMSGDHARHAVVAAYAALAAAGLNPEVKDGRYLRILIQEMNPFLNGSRWSNMYTGSLTVGNAVGGTHYTRAALTPWAWYSEDRLNGIRDAWLRYRSRAGGLTRNVTHPEGSGCYVCGVSTVTLPLHQKEGAWQQRDVTPALIGGRGITPQPHWVCADCQAGLGPDTAITKVSVWRLAAEAAGIAPNHPALELIEGNIRPWGETNKQPGSARFAYAQVGGLKERILQTALKGGHYLYGR